MFRHKGLLGEGCVEPTTRRCPNLFWQVRRVVFIPFHHLFLETNEVVIYQPALVRFSTIYASYDLYRIGISWIRMMDVDEFQYCCGTNGLSWGIFWGERFLSYQLVQDLIG